MNKHITTQNGTVLLVATLILALSFIGYSAKQFDDSFKNITRIISTASQVAQVSSSLTDGLVAHYTFDEGSGTTAGDSVGGNNGTLVNGPTWTTGKVGSGALKFDGVDDRIKLGSLIATPGAFSFSLWINPNILSASGGTFIGGINANSSFLINNRSVVTLRDNGASPLDIAISGTLFSKKWQHLVVVRDSNNSVQVYLDGSNVTSGTPIFSITKNWDHIGNRSDGASPFDGSLDDIRIYNRVLQSNEITDLYNMGTTVSLSDTEVPSTPSNLAASVVSSSQINISWSASTDNTAVTGYKIYRGGTEIYSTANLTYQDTNLSAGTPYSYTVSAYDAAGNESNKSASVSAVTQSIVIDVPQSVASTTEWYASPAGSAGGTGSIDNPWDIQTAFNGGGGKVKPGHTVWLRGGKYGNGGNTVYTVHHQYINGTESKPIVFRQYPGERAIIDGGIWNTAEWVTFWGFEITNTSTVRKLIGSDKSYGFLIGSVGTKLINMVVHDTGHPGIGGGSSNSEVYGTIIWGTGVYDTSNPQIPVWTRGSGIYAQNRYGTAYISDVISFKEFTDGIKAYTQSGYAEGFDLDGNIVFDNNLNDLFVDSQNNLIQSLKVTNNYSYREDANLSAQFGGFFVENEHNNLTLKDNYFVNGNNTYGALFLGKWKNIISTGNTIISQKPTVPVLKISKLNTSGSYTWNQNKYFGGLLDFPFLADSLKKSFIDWKNETSFDADSSYSSSLPDKNFIVVRPNKYEEGRANIVVYNWEKKDQVSVDISNIGLRNGDSFVVQDVQNFLGSPVLQGTYSGQSINLPMNLTTITPLIGAQNITHFNPATHTDKKFNVFVIRKLGGGSDRAPGWEPPVIVSPTPTPISGSCSSTLNRCASGTFSNTTDTSTHYLWSCTGSNGGSSASCSLPISTSNQDIVIQNTLPTPQITDPITPTPPSSTTFTLTLTQSSPTIRLLQQTLNNKGYLVSTTGSGSKGNETTYFGQATLTALKKYQCTILKRCSGNLHGVLDQETATSLGITLTTTPVTTTTNKFTRSLTIGSTGQDVKNLQIFLNSKGYTVSTTGAGSKGQETTYFGQSTQRALIKFQEAYRSEILTPNGLTRGTGYFGPSTMRKVNGGL